MNYESHPKYEIECAIMNAKMTTPSRNKILRIRRNWDKITNMKQPEIGLTEGIGIRRLKHEMSRKESIPKHQRKNIEAMIDRG
jgi:hypothetical protein